MCLSGALPTYRHSWAKGGSPFWVSLIQSRLNVCVKRGPCALLQCWQGFGKTHPIDSAGEAAHPLRPTGMSVNLALEDAAELAAFVQVRVSVCVCLCVYVYILLKHKISKKLTFLGFTHACRSLA